jgi:hypothetical protein
MTGIIVPPEVLARLRAERERQRRQRELYVGSILDGLLDAEDDQPSAPATPTREKETRR